VKALLLDPRSLRGVVRKSIAGFSADNASSMGAALAFYSLLSMAPLIVLVITIAGLFIGRDDARQLLFTQLSGLLGDTGAQGVSELLRSATTDKDGILQTVVSFVVLVAGATTVFAELQSDLNRIWKCDSPRSSGLWGWIRTRLLSFGLIAALGFLLLVSLVMSAAIAYMGSAWFGGSEAAGHVLDIAASIIVLTGMFALIYKVLPGRHIPFGDVLLGALITAVLFEGGKFLIGMYIGKSAVASKFGAAGTVVVAIMWVYYSSQIFFFGSELTRAYSEEHGSKRLDRAANSDLMVETDMVRRAREIVRGRDPVLLQKRS
jgi:membrane protein